MTETTRRPIPVIIVAAAYLAVGIIREVAMHTVMAVLIVWLLFRASSGRWFQPPSAEPV